MNFVEHITKLPFPPLTLLSTPSTDIATVATVLAQQSNRHQITEADAEIAEAKIEESRGKEARIAELEEFMARGISIVLDMSQGSAVCGIGQNVSRDWGEGSGY